MLAAREDEPGSPLIRGLEAAKARRAFAIARSGVMHEDEADLVEEVAGGFVDAHLGRRGLRLDEEQRGRVCRAVAQAVHLAAEILAQRADGDWTPDPKATRFPSIETIDVLDWRVEFARYVRLQTPKLKTARSFEKRIGELMARVGSNDLRKITPKHVDDWASDLLISGSDPLTVRDGYLAAVKRICSFVRLKLPVNAAVGIPSTACFFHALIIV